MEDEKVPPEIDLRRETFVRLEKIHNSFSHGEEVTLYSENAMFYLMTNGIVSNTFLIKRDEAIQLIGDGSYERPYEVIDKDINFSENELLELMKEAAINHATSIHFVNPDRTELSDNITYIIYKKLVSKEEITATNVNPSTT